MTFRARTSDCPDCHEGKYESRGRYGYIEHICETCDGLGEVDCACAECNVIRPLNDDGLCRDCSRFLADDCSLTEVHSDPFKRRAA